MKKIIFLGEGCYFFDSLIYFKEHSIKITMVISDHIAKVFRHNINLAKDIGIDIIKYVDESQFYKSLNLDSSTIVIGGGYFGGEVASSKESLACEIMNLEMLYKISKFNHEHNCGAKIIRYFNGDTGFGTDRMRNLFSDKMKHVDILMFDNDMLQEFVLQNVPSLKNKKSFLGWFETPLERFVHHNCGNNYNKKVICAGRNLCCSQYILNKKISILQYPFYLDWNNFRMKDFIKKVIHKYFFHRKSVYYLAGAENIHLLNEDRYLFFTAHKDICFGLSNLYDIFEDSVARFKDNKEFYFSIIGQNCFCSSFSEKELYYCFTNSPSKDISYMMNGIIPLISHKEHNVYKSLVDNRMAILIKDIDDLEKVHNMSNSEIQEYRDNIYKNRSIFTFERVGRFIINEFN